VVVLRPGRRVASAYLFWPLVAPHFGLVEGADGAYGAPGSVKRMAATYGLKAALFVPGLLAGGLVGWFIIGPVNGRSPGFSAASTPSLTPGRASTAGRRHEFETERRRVAVLRRPARTDLFRLFESPGGFIPNQDKGTSSSTCSCRTPPPGPHPRSDDQIQAIVQRNPGVAHTVDIPGQSFVMNGVSSNFGSVFIVLKPFHERRAPELYSEAIANDLRGQLDAAIGRAQILVFGAPAVDGLGNAGGFKLMLESTGNTACRPSKPRRPTSPQGQCAAGLHRPVQQLPRVDAAALRRRRSRQVQDHEGGTERRLRHVAGLPGGFYVNDINRFGRTWQVNVQADAPFRVNAEAVKKFCVRNAGGGMVPLGSVATIRDEQGPVFVLRYNMLTATAINGAVMPNVSSGDVIKTWTGCARRSCRATWILSGVS